MNNINTRKWSTPMIIGAGLFVAISGVLMFFHIEAPLEFAHEWIGMVFAIGILLHVLSHWTSFRNYFRQRRPLAVIALVTIATGSLIIASAGEEGGGNLMMSVIRSVEAAPLTEVAPLLDQDAVSIVDKFHSAGFLVDSTERSIAEIATSNQVEPRELIAVLYNSSE